MKRLEGPGAREGTAIYGLYRYVKGMVFKQFTLR